MQPAEILTNPDRWALFLDVDGTILDVAATPDDVDVPPDLMRSLQRVEPLLSGALALVSGRTIATLDRLFAPLSLTAAGEHGAELRLGPGQPIARCSSRLLDPELKSALQQLVVEHPALLLEEKPASIVVHYRRAPEIGRGVERRLQAILTKADQGLGIFPSKMSWDIRDGTCSKGTALVQIMAQERFCGRLPVYIGDDRTDEDGFTEAERAGGIALAVAGEYRASRAPAFASPAAVRAWLAHSAGLRGAAA
ncbi:MAG: trehalose-phosphatase [Dongiaceae bacterium]